MALRIGDIVTFTYPAVHQQGTKAHDRFPQIIVLHPGWPAHTPPPNIQTIRGGKLFVHGLNMNYLVDDEVNAIRMFTDPAFEQRYVDALQRKNPRLVNEIERITLNLVGANITSPHDFYRRALKPFIAPRGYDPYRLYAPEKMTAVRTIQRQEVLTGKSRASKVFNQMNLRDKNSNETKIIQWAAQAKALDALTPQQRRFIERLQGTARKIFDDYVKKFEYAKGPQMFPM
jgi:hypothetical protein